MQPSIDGSSLSIQIKDLTFLGNHELTLTGIVNDSVATQLPADGLNKIIIEAGNACAITEIIPAELDDMIVQVEQRKPIYQTFKSFTDTASEDQKTKEVCGKMEHKLLKITIIVNTLHEHKDSKTEIIIEGRLRDHPYATAGIAKFWVDIRGES